MKKDVLSVFLQKRKLKDFPLLWSAIVQEEIIVIAFNHASSFGHVVTSYGKKYSKTVMVHHHSAHLKCTIYCHKEHN